MNHLKKHKLQLPQREIDHLKSPIIIKKIEFMIFIPYEIKCLVPDGFTGEFHQVFKAELTPILHTLPENRRRWNISQFIYETIIILIISKSIQRQYQRRMKKEKERQRGRQGRREEGRKEGTDQHPL